MFYAENVISDLMICPCCKKVYNDPRLVDCGESMCNDCIFLRLNKERNGFNCVICHELHELPKNGFRKNQRLAKLVEIKPDEVTRSPIANELKAQLNRIHEKIKILENDLKIGSNKIKEYCDFIRHDVDLVTESWYECIKSYHDEFMETISTYEKDCLKKYETFNQKKKPFESFISDSEKFYRTWNDYLKGFKIDDSELIKVSHEAKQLIFDLDKEEAKLKAGIFNGKLLVFEEDNKIRQSSLVGKIIFQDINLISDKPICNLKKKKRIPFNNTMFSYDLDLLFI